MTQSPSVCGRVSPCESIHNSDMVIEQILNELGQVLLGRISYHHRTYLNVQNLQTALFEFIGLKELPCARRILVNVPFHQILEQNL